MSAAAAASGGVPSSLSPARASQIADFCALTGLGAPDKNGHGEFAASFLEGHAWDMDAAVNAYLEMKADSAAGDADAEYAAAAAMAAAADGGEEQVRAPLPDKQERLFDESPEELARRAYLHAQMLQGRLPPELAFGDAPAARSARRAPARNTANSMAAAAAAAASSSVARAIDPFRNFAAEVGWRAAQPAAAGAAVAAGSGRPSKSASSKVVELSKLFAPPSDLLLKGPSGAAASMEEASAEALRQKKWLLINVQQADEFSSHQLNRDVWRHTGIAALVRENFIFCQLGHNTAEGTRYRSLYRPPAIPSIALIDPETHMKLWDCHADSLADVDAAAPPTLRDAARKGELVVGVPFIRRLHKELQKWAARKDLQMDGVAAESSDGRSGGRSAAESEEERMLQAAINASLENSPASSPAKPARPAATAAAPAAPSSRAAPSVARRLNPAAPAASSSQAIVVDSDDNEAIVLDDSDGDEAEGPWGDSGSHDEEYVPISDSDGELEVHTRKATSQEDDVLAISSSSRKAASAPQAGEKRKRSAASVDEESQSSSNAKVSRTDSNAASSSDDAVAAPAAAPAPAPAPAPAVPVPAEPAAGPTVCRLQIRLPGGGRPAQRRFLKSEPIRGVIAFARSLMPEETRHSKLLLVSSHPRRELTDEEMSIEAHGLVNSSVIVEIVE